jgi:hypothetical protein
MFLLWYRVDAKSCAVQTGCKCIGHEPHAYAWLCASLTMPGVLQQRSTTNRLETTWSVTTTSPWQYSKGAYITWQFSSCKQRSDHSKSTHKGRNQTKQSCGNRIRAFNIILTYTYTYRRDPLVSPKTALQTATRSKLRAPFLAHPSPHIRRCWALWPDVDHSRGSP